MMIINKLLLFLFLQPDELSFEEGDILYILDKVSEILLFKTFLQQKLKRLTLKFANIRL